MKAEELIRLQESVIKSQETAIAAHQAFIELQDSIIKNLQSQLDKNNELIDQLLNGLHKQTN